MKLSLMGIMLLLASVDPIRIPTLAGITTLEGAQARDYSLVTHYLRERYAEAETIRVGSTYAELARHFTVDGGITPVSIYRFRMILCPFIKIDVEFDRKFTSFTDLDPGTRLVRVSKPYFEPPFTD